MANAWIIKPLPISAVTPSSTALGAGLNIGGDYAGVIWQANTGTTASLLIDLGADVPLDTIAAFGLQGGISPSATVAINLATAAQGPGFSGTNTTSGTGTNNYWGSGAQTLFAGTVTPTSGKGVMLWSAPTTSGPPASVRYIFLVFGAMGASAALQVSRIVAGKRIQFARNFDMGAAFGVRDLGGLDFSARAVLLRRRAKKLRTIGVTFSNVYKDEIEASLKPLIEQVGNTDPIAFITDPSVDPQRQNRCYFGFLVGDLSIIQRNSAGWQSKANLVSLF